MEAQNGIAYLTLHNNITHNPTLKTFHTSDIKKKIKVEIIIFSKFRQVVSWGRENAMRRTWRTNTVGR
jgi:hypothetical protein